MHFTFIDYVAIISAILLCLPALLGGRRIGDEFSVVKLSLQKRIFILPLSFLFPTLTIAAVALFLPCPSLYAVIVFVMFMFNATINDKRPFLFWLTNSEMVIGLAKITPESASKIYVYFFFYLIIYAFSILLNFLVTLNNKKFAKIPRSCDLKKIKRKVLALAEKHYGKKEALVEKHYGYEKFNTVKDVLGICGFFGFIDEVQKVFKINFSGEEITKELGKKNKEDFSYCIHRKVNGLNCF